MIFFNKLAQVARTTIMTNPTVGYVEDPTGSEPVKPESVKVEYEEYTPEVSKGTCSIKISRNH